MTTSSYKHDFPALRHHRRLAYLDSAASTLVPRVVVDAIAAYYRTNGANVARGVYGLSADATAAYETARATVARFVGATPETTIFTSGTTAALNMTAYGMTPHVTSRHNIVVTAMDHHANFLPWQRLAQHTGAAFRVAPVTNDGSLDTDALATVIDRRTAVVALPLVSNVLGAIVPVADIVVAVRRLAPDAVIVVDAAQAVAHLPITITTLGCDLLAFGGHKMYGPTGIGVLVGTHAALDRLDPLLVGGEMVDQVSAVRATYKDIPYRLEAGTPPIADAIGLAAAADYLQDIGMATVRAHDLTLLTYAATRLESIDGVTILGPTDPRQRAGLIAFTIDGVHPHDLAHILDDQQHVAIRAGMHCAQPLHRDTLGIGATARLSVALYTDTADIDALTDGITQAVALMTNPSQPMTHNS